MITVEAQGRTFEFPDGTTNDQIGAALDEFFAQGSPAPQDTGILETITGTQRTAALPQDVQQLPELASLTSPVTTGDFGSDIQIAAGLLTSFDEDDRKDIIKNAVPDVTFEEFEGTTVVNLPNGQRAVLNAAGLSTSDVLAGIAQTLSFVPAGGIASLGRNLAQRLTLGGAASGATEAGLQTATQALGSEQGIDEGQVAAATILGGASELAPAAITGGRQLIEAAKKEIPQQVSEALQQGRVFTSDLFPPDTFIGANLQRLAEKIPVVGTGNLRSTQQAERQQAARDFAGEFNIDLDTPFEEEIVSSAGRVFDRARERASNLRNQAVESLRGGGNVETPQTREVIEQEIARQEGLGARADNALLTSLRAIQNELSGNFQRIGDIRTTVNHQITDIGRNNSPIASGGDAALNNVRRALTDDMTTFARDFSRRARRAGAEEDGRAFNRWQASNRIFAEGFENARDAQLKKVLTKGEATPEVVLTTLRGGKTSDLRRLNNNLDAEGRQAARQTLLKEVFDKSGGLDEINPTRLINELQRPNIRKATNVFFTGNAKKELEGFKTYLDLTRRAQQAGVVTATGQELLAPGAALAAGIAPEIAIPVLATVSGGARVFESPAVRDLMIRLGQTEAREGQERLLREFRPLILAESRREKEE